MLTENSPVLATKETGMYGHIQALIHVSLMDKQQLLRRDTSFDGQCFYFPCKFTLFPGRSEPVRVDCASLGKKRRLAADRLPEWLPLSSRYGWRAAVPRICKSRLSCQAQCPDSFYLRTNTDECQVLAPGSDL